MELLELMRTRRSIRKYTDAPVSEENSSGRNAFRNRKGNPA